MPKYFYVCTIWDKEDWVDADGHLKNAVKYTQYIGSECWPHTRREARLQDADLILQFETQTLKFVKVVS